MHFREIALLVVVLIGLASAWPEEWAKGSATDPDQIVKFTLALEQRNLDEFNRLFERITTPGSPEYGKYRTIEELTNMIAPSKEEQEAVLSYLEENSCTGESFGDFILASGPVWAVEKLFQVKYHNFVHRKHGVVIHRSGDLFPQIPLRLQNVVTFVTGVSTFPRTKTAPRKVEAATTTWVVPQTLRALYGIPNTPGTNSKNSMAVVEFGAVAGISQSDLNTFNQLTDGPSNAKLAYTVGNFAFTPISPIDGESTLDVQYIMAVAQGIPCSFWVVDGWMYDFTTLVQSRQSKNQPTALVYSMSYAWSEYEQCDITGAGTSCKQVGGTDASYISTTNTNFQKLGATGITLLSASGDAGAPSKANIDCSNHTYPVQAEYPASSPYITAVGGTMLQNGGTALTGNLPPFCTQVGVTCAGGGTEIVCSVPTALITSGGGFSSYSARPSYQTTAVNTWLSSNSLQPPSQYWNASGRASPDVAGLAHQYMIVENGQKFAVDGTSASTPVTAGIIALINDQRLNAGKPAVGFINPALYAMSTSSFTDVTSGDNTGTEKNGATEKYCNGDGYGSATGWDPTTGRGTPKFSAWSSYWSSN